MLGGWSLGGCGGGGTTIVPPPVTERIVFQSDKSGNFDIWVMNGNGTGQLRLTSNAANDIKPAFRPDRNRIAFSSDRDGNPEIYVMNADGSSQTRLTNDVAASDSPSFSPNGTKIVFKSGGNIALMNADGSQVQMLTNTTGIHEREPAWSPDGTSIAYFSDAGGEYSLHVRPANGKGQATLATFGGGTLTATRDGDKIVLTDSTGGKAVLATNEDKRSNGVVYHVDGVLMPAKSS